ncbi:YggS family pyridoxal phosphate-dependent enzyme [Candidatus Pelagibacter communis]|uniref:YggS family pyridoxal phosphate-dependent enzyme n=1 Tax=Pelagibacter ubique TaxID=198252 RepID=UPI00094D8837|nr:YggS family pyridoxal phosphate-dependent enzyme [Candidatus Pelagibacter ubique]
MENVVKNFNLIKQEIIGKKKIKLVAVTKTFPISHILPVINEGHTDFGENKVQEAMEKWISIKKDFPKINLHLIGKLQTNKVKFVLPLFDYIHSLDNLKLASKIADEQIKKNFKPKIFIQVNIGDEAQKGGIEISNLENFYKRCIEEFKLNIIGLMCIPPFDNDSNPYFIKMRELSENLGLKDISMGMSDDYMDAIKQGSTFIRIGSKIFGARS